MVLDVVVWWDRNESEWKVFDDACAHRLAPLSEGRIDQWGRLQNRRLMCLQKVHFCFSSVFQSLRLGPSNWHKPCFLPTKSDAHIVAFRAWLRKYSGGQLDRGTEFNRALLPTPPREQLMDRYWSHVVKCSRCSVHTKIFSVALIGIPAVNHGMMSVAARTTLVSMAAICFAASRCLSFFIYTHAFC
uniref:Rieske domain-containing protein n=1 Tax=Vitis vinifera TaxID=29760 RepID=A5BZW1_VITVI|nr:hypothetical protein VITISV_040536 [Vitis vinifera]